MVSNLRTPILNFFYHLLSFYFITQSEFSCLAMVAKLYPVSAPTYLPQIPNQHLCMSKLRRPKQVRFCTGVSANLVWVICPIYLLLPPQNLTTQFFAQLPTKMHDFPPKYLSLFLLFYPLFSKMHHILGVLELENLASCCSPIHAFFSYLENSLFTPLASKMLQNDIIFLFVLRGLAIRDMQQRNSLQLHTASGHSETGKNRMQSISTFCASRREAFGMRGLAILTVALGSV